MHRRHFLASALRLGAVSGIGSLAANGLARTGPPIEVVTHGWSETPVSINRTRIEATVLEASRSAATVRLTAPSPVGAFVPTLVRRRFPQGPILDVTRGPRIEAVESLDDVLTLEVDHPPLESVVDAWQYELRLDRQGEGGDLGQYLCESDPLGRLDREFAPPESSPGSDRGGSFERTDRPGRYELEFRWADGGTRWTLEHAVSKAAFERARSRDRGYVTTALESLSNPYVSHLADRLTAEAVRSHGASRTGSVDEAALFARTVRFVQSFEYAADAESMGPYDYHRTVEESLVDGVCDCKDGTYLLAGLLAQPPFEYECGLVLMADHMLPGVHRDDLPSPYDDLETVGDSPYVPVETTKRASIGHVRDEPIVAIVGPSFQHVDETTLDSTLRSQIRRLYEYYRND